MQTPVARGVGLLLALCVGVGPGTACGDDDGVPPDAAVLPDARSPDAPPESFDRFCPDRVWDADLQPVTLPTLDGTYLGVYPELPTGTELTMKIVPQYPMLVGSIRAAFVGNPGTVRISITKAWGRSYPDPDGALFGPVDVSIADPDPDVWTEIDLSAEPLFLQPTQHYTLVVETLTEEPYLALEALVPGDRSHALMIVPGERYPYGSEGNFRLQLTGQTFCRWTESERWFGADRSQPFSGERSQRVAITDLDGDGHDDVIVNAGGPKAFLGDGLGNFTPPSADPFPDVPRAAMLVFADVDNDGDVDAFAAHYVNADGDGDGIWVADGDCNDASALIHPGATEVPANGVDDDCDGTADDGLDTTDRDEDGYAIADGDCDDTRATTYPGAEELLDGRDNDCDGETDEDFVNRILLNDGSGQFAAVPSAGVEVLDHAVAAGFGDADGDGNLDLYWGNWLVTYPQNAAVQDVYVTGNGDGTFTEATQAAGLILPTPYSVYGVLWADYNNDGLPDIYVGNYHAFPNLLWENQGDGTFANVAVDVGVAYDDISSGLLGAGQTFGMDWGDIDNDGDLDLFVANIAHPRDRPSSDPSLLLLNNGAPNYTFFDVTADSGIVYDEGDVNAAFADFDNDMDLDLVVCALYTGHYVKLYRNDGPLGFADVTYEASMMVHDSVSPVWSDVDEDGDLDLLIADRDGGGHVTLFINRLGQDNQWVQFVLEGTTTNRDAIGARVTLTAGGVTQLREVKGGGGHSNTQSSRVVHFGLAQQTEIDEITVRWVGGATETFTGAAPGARYRLVEGTGSAEAL